MWLDYRLANLEDGEPFFRLLFADYTDNAELRTSVVYEWPYLLQHPASLTMSDFLWSLPSSQILGIFELARTAPYAIITTSHKRSVHETNQPPAFHRPII